MFMLTFVFFMFDHNNTSYFLSDCTLLFVVCEVDDL